MSKEQNKPQFESSVEHLQTKPSMQQREAAKSKMLQTFSSWARVRIDEVFAMADEDKKPEFGARITWRDLNEVRDLICSGVADDLELDFDDQILGILEHELRPLGSNGVVDSNKRLESGEANIGQEEKP